MTDKEAVKEITSHPKWYAIKGEDRKGESTYRVTALRILNGTAKHEAKKNFFETFGYEYNIKEEINKK